MITVITTLRKKTPAGRREVSRGENPRVGFFGGKKRVDSEKYSGEVGQGDDIYKLMKHHFMN